MNSHARSLRWFARKLAVLLVFRSAVRWATVWLFVWGAVVLAGRISGALEGRWLVLGALAAVPFAMLAAAWEQRKRAGFHQVRATYDRVNRCGGMIMAEEAADMSAWQGALPQPSSPVLRWRSGRAFGMLSVSVLFVLVTMYLPDRFTTLAAQRPLEIGKLVGELHTEVQTLARENILEPKKAQDLQKQLSRLKEQSSSLDPNKTWEALDHIKESNSDLARQAAQEALSKMASLTEAQTLASALDKATQSGLGPDTATRAARDVAALLKAAKLEDGLVKGQIPPELLSNLDGLSQKDLEKLLSAIQFNKNNLGSTITNLANLHLIDPKLLAQCKNASLCRNPNALAEFLCQCTNSCDSFCNLAVAYCRNIKPGDGGAPMTWKDESSEQGAKFKEDVLPPSGRLSDAQLVGVSRAAPKLTGDSVVTEHGALTGAQGSGGAAHSQLILPRYRQAVQRFFKREE